MSWTVLTGVFFIIPLVLALFPSAIYDNFFQFLLWSGVAYAPLSAIYIADYFMLRKQRIDLVGIYETGPSSPYAFWGGWNPAALVSLGAGSLTYILLLNPKTLEQYIPGFNYLTASLPSFVVAGALYLLLTALFVRRSGKGGYGVAPTL